MPEPEAIDTKYTLMENLYLYGTGTLAPCLTEEYISVSKLGTLAIAASNGSFFIRLVWGEVYT